MPLSCCDVDWLTRVPGQPDCCNPTACSVACKLCDELQIVLCTTLTLLILVDMFLTKPHAQAARLLTCSGRMVGQIRL